MYQRVRKRLAVHLHPLWFGWGDFIAFQDKQWVVCFSCRSAARNLSLALYTSLKKSLAITCLYAKDKIIIQFDSYEIKTILCRLRPRMKSPIQDGTGPIPHSLALYCAVNGLIVSLTYIFLQGPKLGKWRNVYCHCKYRLWSICSV